jgi:hypothetical protein
MLIELNISIDKVESIASVLPGIPLPNREQLPKSLQKVYNCNIVLNKGAGSFVLSENMLLAVKRFLSLLKPALMFVSISSISHNRECKADFVGFSRVLLDLCEMTSFPYHLANSELTISIAELKCKANPDIELAVLKNPDVPTFYI